MATDTKFCINMRIIWCPPSNAACVLHGYRTIVGIVRSFWVSLCPSPTPLKKTYYPCFTIAHTQACMCMVILILFPHFVLIANNVNILPLLNTAVFFHTHFNARLKLQMPSLLYSVRNVTKDAKFH